MTGRERCCDNCTFVRRIKPRPDEVEKYGPNVMDCRRYGWEGYTQPEDVCEAFRPN